MKNYKEVVGMDVSKKTLGAYCHQAQLHKQFVNDVGSYKVVIV